MYPKIFEKIAQQLLLRQKLTSKATKQKLAIISLAASLILTAIAFSGNGRVSSQSSTSSLKQKHLAC